MLVLAMLGPRVSPAVWLLLPALVLLVRVLLALLLLALLWLGRRSRKASVSSIGGLRARKYVQARPQQ